MVNKYISDQIKKSIDVKQKIFNSQELINLIQEVALRCVEVYKKGNKTLIAGNGRSAADAQHIAGEFVGRFYFNKPGLASIALMTDTSIMTAIGINSWFNW